MRHFIHVFSAVAVFAMTHGQAIAGPYLGNSLAPPAGVPNSADGAAPLVILGDYTPGAPTAPSGIQFSTSGYANAVQFYGRNYNFTAYILQLVSSGSGRQTFTVVSSESFSGTETNVGAQSLAATGLTFNIGDYLAFAGIGPYFPQTSNDAVGSDATFGSGGGFAIASIPGGAGSQFSVGANGDSGASYRYVSDSSANQGRTYEFGVTYTSVPEPATAVLLVSALVGVVMGRRNFRRT